MIIKHNKEHEHEHEHESEKENIKKDTSHARARDFPEDFQLSPKLREWCAANCPLVDPEFAFAEFRDYCLANGKKYSNWEAALRNSMRRSQNYKGNGPARPGQGASGSGRIVDRAAPIPGKYKS